MKNGKDSMPGPALGGLLKSPRGETPRRNDKTAGGKANEKQVVEQASAHSMGALTENYRFAGPLMGAAGFEPATSRV
jgi:hypothetical protein